ncbi:protein ROOT PRIMORDIUM DEFECTIVE 1 [Amborella trichopoda]|uniref:protein ROOT PRIMORDIUM DEFECTIVE 1 n=1 Tax=Amborella trichopoda TaxID=13333 RepID=UPI0009BDFE77|nr:protein ROOT PRIMORDIUM DEFECTIVE 1 [Amborella trichopoda]|eukprot:XP_006847033.2 protein ROOT PRIMORDIUM DEFECTIVE 1 [Amborella trichopoda]
MGFRSTSFSSFLSQNLFHGFSQKRGLVKVRLKWVKNRGLDHIIDNETDLKAVSLIKDAIKRSSSGCLSSTSFSDRQKHLGLTIPVLRFIRRYPTIFEEFRGLKYNVPWFRLTKTALLLDEQEQRIYKTHEPDLVERLCRLLMMLSSRSIPLQAIDYLKWDMGLPYDFVKTILPNYSDQFRMIKQPNGRLAIALSRWREEFAVSELQKRSEKLETSSSYRGFKKGMSLAFPLNFPRGYGLQKKVQAWMDEFQKLPYISPYEDSSKIDPNSDLMEKRVVGVLHELLSLTIHKKTKRNYLRAMREEMNLPHKFTRIFTRYPGIFYLSLKCKTTTVALKEAYQRGKLVDPHPLVAIRDKYFYVMRTGVIYRGKGLKELISPRQEADSSSLDNVDFDTSEPYEEISGEDGNGHGQ